MCVRFIAIVELFLRRREYAEYSSFDVLQQIICSGQHTTHYISKHKKLLLDVTFYNINIRSTTMYNVSYLLLDSYNLGWRQYLRHFGTNGVVIKIGPNQWSNRKKARTKASADSVQLKDRPCNQIGEKPVEPTLTIQLETRTYLSRVELVVELVGVPYSL